MNRFSTLRTRLVFTYLGLIMIGFGGLTWLAGRQIAQSAFDDFASNLRVQALLLASSLTESFEEIDEYGLDIPRATTHIQQIAINTQAQVAILDINQIVQLDSTNTTVGQNLSKTPEVRQALADTVAYDVRLNELGIETVYTAAPMVYEERVIGYVQLGKPASIPQEAVRQRWFILGVGFLGFSLFGTLICLWLLSTLTRPLSELRNTALRMASGDLTQRVTQLTKDEIGEVGAAFNQMATQVETMVREQQAFASNASHELRTPLTTIRLRTEALQSGNLDSTTSTQYIAEIDSEVQHMSGLVDDLILLSRLDADRLAVGDQVVDLGRLVQSVQRDLAYIAERKKITLAFNESKQALSSVQANINHAQVVVRNLLENAIKYTPAGGRVTTSLTQIDDVVCLQISDTGQGIAADELPRIVQRFYRADKARFRQTEGVGLGLSLVQSVIDLYGGKLEIKSPGLGYGTTVSVLWPCQYTDQKSFVPSLL